MRQLWDQGTKLYFYGSRWYDPALGQWASPDTIVPDPANPQALNRYSYVLNNPLRYTDPTGHAVCVDEECSLVFHPVSGEIIRRGPGPLLPKLSSTQPAVWLPTMQPESTSIGMPQGPGILDENSLDPSKRVDPSRKNFGEYPSAHPPRCIEEQGAICLTAVTTGIIMAVPLAGWNITLGYVAVKIAFLPPPASIIGEVVLLTIEAVTFEADMLIAQLIAQGAQRECSQIRLRFWPPYDFGPVPDQH